MNEFDEFSRPARKPKHIDKKKRHARGFNESNDHVVSRQARVSFKQYLREIAEEDLLNDDEYDIDEDLDGDA